MILVREENDNKYEFHKRMVEKQNKLFLQNSEDEKHRVKRMIDVSKKPPQRDNKGEPLGYRLPSGRIVPYAAAGAIPVYN